VNVMARPAWTKPQKPLGPQARALERWRVQLEEAGFSDEFEALKQQGNHFDNLSDEEWLAVWHHVVAGSTDSRSPADETRVRYLVDDAAYSSGWFVGYIVLESLKRSQLKTWATEDLAFLKRVTDFRDAAAIFFGEPDGDPTEPYDPWPQRRILAHLDNLAASVKSHIGRQMVLLKQTPPDPPNSVKPDLDRWRARLMLVWSETCGLSSKNSKHLRGFLRAALHPYMPLAELSDKTSRYFIDCWNRGEVERPETSLMVRLHDDTSRRAELEKA
jgi:hypothetical protein